MSNQRQPGSTRRRCTTLALSLLAGGTLASAHAGAAGADGQQIVRAGSQAVMTGSGDHFTGQVRVEPLFAASPGLPAAGAYVTFQPGVRSAWHSHPAGQRLVVIAGTGLTQEWGKPVQTIGPGDAVWCPPGVKHWHGAAPGGAMTHLAVTGVADGKSVQWMERVSDAP